MFKRFADELGFPASNIRAIMAEADENDDGHIEYHGALQARDTRPPPSPLPRRPRYVLVLAGMAHKHAQ